MKIAITADPHLNNNTYQIIDPDSGLYVKSVDAINAFEWFADESIARKVDRVVVLGDTFHNSDPTEAIRRRVSPVLQKLAASKIQVVVITGNHDFCSKYHALESIEGWNKLVKIVDKPFVEAGIASYAPHTIDIECGRTDFRTMIKSLPTTSCGKHIFFGHFGVRGAMRDNLSREDSGGAVSTVDIENTGATIAFLGHFHKYQRIKSNIPVFYVGSIENHRMEDMDGKRGFMIYDTESGEYERVDYTKARPMHSIEVSSLDESMAIFESGEWKSSIVRLSVVGEHKSFLEVRSRIVDIKRLFTAAGGTFIYCADSTGARDKSSSSKVEIESIDQIDIMATLRAEVNERLEDDPEECATILLELEEIYAEESAK